MTRDIRIPVMVTVEEYVAFRVVAEHEGRSLSGMARQLIREAITEYAHDAAARDADTIPKAAQE